MWIFYAKAVPFATSDTHESAQYLNDWKESDVKWESEDEYLVGWYSDFDGGKDDRRFKMKDRKLATGYTRGVCKWEKGTGGWEDDDVEHIGPDDSYVFGYKSDFQSGDRKTEFYFYCYCAVSASAFSFAATSFTATSFAATSFTATSPPPPPSPPPPGNHGVPVVTIGVQR